MKPIKRGQVLKAKEKKTKEKKRRTRVTPFFFFFLLLFPFSFLKIKRHTLDQNNFEQEIKTSNQLEELQLA